MSGLSSKDFAERAELSQATLSQNLNERTLINVSSINKIIETFPEQVDPYWFVFGDAGKDVPRPVTEPAGELPQEVEALQALLLKQAEELARLRSELEQHKKKEIAHITVFYTDNSFSTFAEEK